MHPQLRIVVELAFDDALEHQRCFGVRPRLDHRVDEIGADEVLDARRRRGDGGFKGAIQELAAVRVMPIA